MLIEMVDMALTAHVSRKQRPSALPQMLRATARAAQMVPVPRPPSLSATPDRLFQPLPALERQIHSCTPKRLYIPRDSPGLSIADSLA